MLLKVQWRCLVIEQFKLNFTAGMQTETYEANKATSLVLRYHFKNEKL